MRFSLLLLPAGVLFACGEAGTGDEAVKMAAPANTVVELPLQRGFYVMSDTSCSNASNATLLLIHRAGMNGARDACVFESIEQIGPTSYRAVMMCRNLQGQGPELATNVYEIPDAAQFIYGTKASDYRSHFRYCEQSSLPDPWRDNDISDLVGERTGR
jgi:hypothetical protein